LLLLFFFFAHSHLLYVILLPYMGLFSFPLYSK
jgi:hypothetical protein